jgi:indole-3-glycerol phosphate synthase
MSNELGLLDRIVRTKREEVELLKREEGESVPGHNPDGKAPFSDSQEPPSFAGALRREPGSPLRVIAECKKASPSRGLLRPHYDPGALALEYARLGAGALSILTDRTYFQGEISHLDQARQSGLPLLRKDFIISPLQIREAKLHGASAILLIVRLLSDAELKELLTFARSLGLDVLTEVHNQGEAERALAAGASIIGINHRDLDTLTMDLSLTERLAPMIRKENPSALVVAESGVESREGRMQVEPHADAILIGTAFMGSEDMEGRWKEIFG